MHPFSTQTIPNKTRVPYDSPEHRKENRTAMNLNREPPEKWLADITSLGSGSHSNRTSWVNWQKQVQACRIKWSKAGT